MHKVNWTVCVLMTELSFKQQIIWAIEISRESMTEWDKNKQIVHKKKDKNKKWKNKIKHAPKLAEACNHFSGCGILTEDQVQI